MRHIIIISFLVSLTTNAKSQIKRINYCQCNTANELSSQVKYRDSVFSEVEVDGSFYTITIYNTTPDTVYLFSSYIQEYFFNSKFLHRVNTSSGFYKVSFTPIIPFVFTKYSDVVTTSNSIIGHQQVVYDFIKMQPNSYYAFSIPVINAFRYGEAIKDFPAKELNKFDYKTTFKNLSVKEENIDKLTKIFEFAYYKDVSMLCNQSDYYLKELEFNKQATSFEILQTMLDK